MKSIISLILFLFSWIMLAEVVTLQGGRADYSFSPDNGSLLSVKDKNTGNYAVKRVENHYFLQSVSGDAEAFERDDKVLSKTIGKNQVRFVCSNPGLKGLTLEKVYHVDAGRLRRKLVFRSSRQEDTAFVTPRTRVHFSDEFYNGGFYLGSGYIGPLMAVPNIRTAQQERSFLQTSKGMLLYHDGDRGSFAHYRTHLNGKFVFPWWQSAIVTYQEKPNALFYQPDGWEMALGTIDVRPGETFSIDDTFAFFDGNWHTFLNDIYPNDPVVSKVLKGFRPGPSWLADTKVHISSSNIHDLQRLALLVDEGEIIAMIGKTGSWGDYHFDTPRPGASGGTITEEELREFAQQVKSISPIYRVGIYNWVNSAMSNSRVVKEHPEFFMFKTRNNQEKSLFPGNYYVNYPVMMNRPEAAAYMLDNFRSLIDTFGFDFIYLDETKTVSLIDWEKNDLMRDDHWADFWMGMHKLGQEKNVLMFGNGRGNPYHELNFIEARHQLAPGFWRKFCGMAMAVANFVNQRPGARVNLLYWNAKMDYIPRVLANGFMPTINYLRYQQIPYITANYELGKSIIYDLKYTPDWKNDATTELESYAIRRDLGQEMVLSLINRSAKNSVDVSVDTKDLPEHLSVWAYRVNKYDDVPAKYGFGEKERRLNYRSTGWRENVITRPELLFMGRNPGKLALHLDDFPKDEFVQIVFSGTSGGTYSINDLPCNYFLSGARQLKVTGAGDAVEVQSEAERAEVIIFQAPGEYQINGKKVLARPVRFGKGIYSVLSVEKGQSVIRRTGDADYPSGKFTAECRGGRLNYAGKGYVCIYDQKNVLLYCGDSPSLPVYHDAGKLRFASLDESFSADVEIPCGKPSPAMQLQPPKLEGAKLAVRKFPQPIRRDGAVLSESAEYISRWSNVSGAQPNLVPFMSEVDEKALSVTTGTTRRIMDYSGVTAAGFLLENAKKVELELNHTFANVPGLDGMHVGRYRRNPGEFAGIMLDYGVGEKQFVRKAFSMGVLHHPQPRPGGHAYGAKTPASEIYLMGDWCDDAQTRRFTLDLQKFAPPNWNGKVYVSAATGFISPDRRLTLRFVRFNDAVQAPEITPVDLAAFTQELKVKRKVEVPFASGGAGYAEVMKTPLKERFYKVGLGGYSDAVKCAALAYDETYVYGALEVGMPSSVNQVEFWLVGRNKKIWQFIANSDGSGAATCNLQPFADKRLKIQVDGNSRFFFAVPRDLLVAPNVKAFRFNLACYRHASSSAQNAFATYSALLKGFYEPANFAVAQFGPEE